MQDTLLVLRPTVTAMASTTAHFSTAEVSDKILLKGLVFHGYHGVLEEVST